MIIAQKFSNEVLFNFGEYWVSYVVNNALVLLLSMLFK